MLLFSRLQKLLHHIVFLKIAIVHNLQFFQYLLHLGLPDILLLWRSVLRKLQTEMQRDLIPTSIAKEVLCKEASLEVEKVAAAQGRIQAVDLLIDNLLEMRDPKWIGWFADALEEQLPALYHRVIKIRDTLMKDEVFSEFSACRYMVSKTVSAKGANVELEDLGVRLEIPQDAIPKEELVSMSIVSPDIDHPPLGDNFIIAPIVRLDPDGLQFKKPITLTVQHSAIDLKMSNLQIWCKTQQKSKIVIAVIILSCFVLFCFLSCFVFWFVCFVLFVRLFVCLF